MSAYAVACVHTVEFGPDIVEYLSRIDATLDAYDGRFLIHGGSPEVIEGSWGQDVIVLEFPDRERMHAWYDSPAYREIAPLRTRRMVADLVFVDGVTSGYRGADQLQH